MDMNYAIRVKVLDQVKMLVKMCLLSEINTVHIVLYSCKLLATFVVICSRPLLKKLCLNFRVKFMKMLCLNFRIKFMKLFCLYFVFFY